MIDHLKIKISGRVQGVFFRGNSKEVADKLNIKGFARNEADGSLYIEAEGDKKSLNEFLKWCQKGPPTAVVEKVETTKGEVKNYQEYEIR